MLVIYSFACKTRELSVGVYTVHQTLVFGFLPLDWSLVHEK